jgi:C-terminal processing protease CtpA/Prc
MSYSVSVLNQTAAAEMESAVKKMEDEGVQSYILDLRNNPVSHFLSQLIHMFVISIKKD